MFMLAARVLLLWAVLASSVCAAINPHPDVASVTDSRGGKTLTYRYSPGGLLNYKQDGDGNRTDYLYDAVGRLTGIWLPNFDYVAYSHDRTGRRVQKWQSEGGIDTYYAWNADGSLAGLTNYANATALTSHSYGYDAFGRKASATEYFNPYPIAWSYGHDALDRLTEVRYAFNGGAQTLLGAYRYDPRGNRTRSTASNGSYRASVLDGGQRLARLDDYSSAGALLGTVAQFQYDANGDLTQKQAAAGSLALSWDPEGHLATAASTGTGAVSQSYLYDDQGRRIRKTSGASTTHYLYDGADIHAEYATWATPQAVYAHGAGTDEPIAKLAGATDEPGADARYYHADGQGSITAQTQGGTLYGWVMQDPWGVIQISLGSGAPKYGYSYQGRERDETGLVYYRNRYYDPLSVGIGVNRFVSRDPLGPAGGTSPYAAFGNDPVDYGDPDGLMPRAVNPFGDYASFSGLGASSPSMISSGRTNLATISNSPANVFNDTLAGRVVNGMIGGPATTLFGGQNNVNPLTGYINNRPRTEQAMDFVSMGVGPELKAGIPLAGGVVAALKSIPKDVTYLYQKLGAAGEHLKYGISKNPETRYTEEELAGGQLKILAMGPRKDMLKLERDLHETLPIGPEEGQKFYIQKQIEKGLIPPPYKP
jgi:RHS repeat-associated protein